MKKFSLFCVLAFMATTTVALASWKYPTDVRSDMGDGFTPWTRADVIFATGAELDRVTGGIKYDGSDGRYAVVPMTSGTFNVVRLSGFVSCSGGFSPACLPGGRADGYDSQGRHWQFCTNPRCS